MTVVATEAAIQQAIVEGLRAYGYIVMVTDPAVKRGGAMHTKGLPDLFVGAPGSNSWLALEVKRSPTSPLTLEQRELVRLEAVEVVFDIDTALRHVLDHLGPARRTTKPAKVLVDELAAAERAASNTRIKEQTR